MILGKAVLILLLGEVKLRLPVLLLLGTLRSIHVGFVLAHIFLVDTHNGQIFPFNLIVRNIYQNGYGHKQIGNTHTVVSSGAGSWGPQLRLGTKAEIVCIKVKSVKD